MTQHQAAVKDPTNTQPTQLLQSTPQSTPRRSPKQIGTTLQCGPRRQRFERNFNTINLPRRNVHIETRTTIIVVMMDPIISDDTTTDTLQNAYILLCRK